jgi:predicted nuclease of predicted toxin-antitoxin system
MASRSNRPWPEASFLIDECLSPRLARAARERGHNARHVTQAGLVSTPDPVVAEAAVARADILVTNNARHFRRVYGQFVSHPGLVLILPSVPHAEQVRLFEIVLDHIESEAEIVDHLVEISHNGRITITPWPQPREPDDATS